VIISTAVSSNPRAKKAATYDLTAKIGAIETDTVRVRLYDELDNDDFDKLRKVTDDFMKIDAKYRDNTGIIPDDKKEAALKEASALAQKMFDNGEVIELSIDQNHGIITIWLDSYLPYIYNIDTLE
jgi:endo-1,4-beta-D-glucanase Y